MASPEKSLRAMLGSDIWNDYERGLFSQSECYARLSAKFSVPASDIADALQAALDSMEHDTKFVDLIRRLKATYQLRVVAMSNVSAPDWEFVRKMSIDWSIFDEIFTSAGAGMRKPDLPFYEHVIKATGFDPRRTIFVDDRAPNVAAARSLGMHGFVYLASGYSDFERRLEALFSGPTSRAWRYLEERQGRLHSLTDTGAMLSDNFTQLLILEATGKRSA